LLHKHLQKLGVLGNKLTEVTETPTATAGLLSTTNERTQVESAKTTSETTTSTSGETTTKASTATPKGAS
jgi:hypothetical protein